MEGKFDCIIVGQGIAGILIAFELIQKGYRCALFDNEYAFSASNIAGALLNPINLNTGKIFPHQHRDFDSALNTYNEMEAFFAVKFMEAFPLYLFADGKTKYASAQSNHLLKPVAEKETELLVKYFLLPEKLLKIEEVHHVRFLILKNTWRRYWEEKGLYSPDFFNINQCYFFSRRVNYKGLEADKIIFVEGAKGAKNSHFPNLPFNKNLGNVLHLTIDSIPEYSYHFNGKKLLPLGNHEFWFGSNYQWDFNKAEPNQKWLLEMTALLKSKLKVPFKILNHSVAERPTTAGQQPLLLQHSKYPQAYFFNGLGTRGFSIGPTLSKTFVERYF